MKLKQKIIALVTAFLSIGMISFGALAGNINDGVKEADAAEVNASTTLVYNKVYVNIDSSVWGDPAYISTVKAHVWDSSGNNEDIVCKKVWNDNGRTYKCIIDTTKWTDMSFHINDWTSQTANTKVPGTSRNDYHYYDWKTSGAGWVDEDNMSLGLQDLYTATRFSANGDFYVEEASGDLYAAATENLISVTFKVNKTSATGQTCSQIGTYANSTCTSLTKALNLTGNTVTVDLNGKNKGNTGLGSYVKPIVVASSFTVDFNVQGHGTAPQSQTISPGGKVTKPTDPSEEGYVFGGWYKESGCTNAWNFDTDTVNSNTTLYAKWTVYVPDGTYYFVNTAGWENVYVHYFGGSSSTTWPGTKLTSSNNVFSTGVINASTVIFNNGDNPGVIGSTKTADLPTNGNNGKYYVFKEASWRSQGDTSTNFKIPGIGGVWAVSSAVNMNFAIDSRFGACYSYTPTNAFIADSSKFKFVFIDSTEHWYGADCVADTEDNACKVGQIVNEGGTDKNFLVKVSQKLTLYFLLNNANGTAVQDGKHIHVDALTYNITYKPNGPIADDITDKGYVGIETTLRPSNTFAAPEHSTFSKWTLDSTTGTEYDAGGTYTNNTLNNVSFYAKWTAATYTVSFAGGTGSSGSMLDQSKTHGVDLNLNPNEFIKTGHLFDHWEDSDGNEYEDEGTYNIDKATTMTANWELMSTYTLNLSDGRSLEFERHEIAETNIAEYWIDVTTFKGGESFTSWEDENNNQITVNPDTVWYNNWNSEYNTIILGGNYRIYLKLNLTELTYTFFVEGLPHEGDNQHYMIIHDSTKSCNTGYLLTTNAMTDHEKMLIDIDYDFVVGDYIYFYWYNASTSQKTLYCMSNAKEGSQGFTYDGANGHWTCSTGGNYDFYIGYNDSTGGQDYFYAEPNARNQATAYAQDFMTHLCVVCDAQHGHTVFADLKDVWQINETWNAKTSFEALSEHAQQRLNDATADPAGSYISQCVSLYDYIIGVKYGPENLDPFMDRTSSSLKLSHSLYRNRFDEYKNENITLIIVIAASATLLATTATSLILVKRKKKAK